MNKEYVLYISMQEYLMHVHKQKYIRVEKIHVELTQYVNIQAFHC